MITFAVIVVAIVLVSLWRWGLQCDLLGDIERCMDKGRNEASVNKVRSALLCRGHRLNDRQRRMVERWLSGDEPPPNAPTNDYRGTYGAGPQ